LNNFAIVTFDADFIDISNLRGYPPKIIWLRIGNTSTKNIADRIRAEQNSIEEFLRNSESAFLEII
jgi:predicted nuclease of predicted toxin-antitoxin system